jgi:uncharacterized membrane protein YdjX (TVP38/TMEM64 family)
MVAAMKHPHPRHGDPGHHGHYDGDHRPRSPGLGWVRYSFMAAFVVGLVLAYTLLPLDVWMKAIALELRELGWLGVPVYAATFVVWCLFGLPAALFSIGAGVTWGVLGGAMVAVPSATLTATTAFIVGRYLFRGRFRDWLMHRPRLMAIDRAVTRRGPLLVLLLRFSPVFPFPILNYALGLTHIPLKGFVVATLLGMVPITLMWTYVGSVGAELAGFADLDGELPGEIGTAKIVLGVLGILATAFVTVWVGKAARAALREAAEVQAAEEEAAEEAAERARLEAAAAGLDGGVGAPR